jgi:hypothetical protein
MPLRRRGARRNEGFKADQQHVTRRVANPGHVVVGGDHVADLRPPRRTKEIAKIELGRLATGRRVEAQDARRVALDRGQQYLARSGWVRDRGQAAQPALRMAGARIGVDEPPGRRCPIGPLIDLLADCGVQIAVAFGEGADAQPILQPGKAVRGNLADGELRRGIPADRAGNPRLVDAAEDAARAVAGKHPIDAGLPVVMRRKAADLRQKIWRRAILGKGRGGPAAARLGAAEHPGRPGQIPGRGKEQRHRPGQAGAVAIGGETDIVQRRYCEIACSARRHPLVEDMLDTPASTGTIEHEDGGALRPFRAGPVLPIAVAGIKPAGMGRQHAQLGAAQKPAGGVRRPGSVRNFVGWLGGLRSQRGACHHRAERQRKSIMAFARHEVERGFGCRG